MENELKGKYVRVYTMAGRKYEGNVELINEFYVLINDVYDGKRRLISFLNVSEVTIVEDEEQHDNRENFYKESS